ncbi:MAG: DUF4026 domain-containing protein [Phycisphaerae bacterium]|nr:DUF4026 domain-containing protein [Phycisphaerae bacterium]
MFEWRKKKIPVLGVVLFRGSDPLQAHEFEFLKGKGISVTSAPVRNNQRWALQLEHPRWGRATLGCPKESSPPPKFIYDQVGTITEKEKQTVLAAGTSLTIKSEGPEGDLLRDRKHGLRFMHAVMGDDGLGVVDVPGYSVWSRAMLEDELSHDAELDVEQLLAYHAIHDGDKKTYWIHSHGLGEIGFFDFDIVDPDEGLTVNLSDICRVIAYAIVEGTVEINTDRFLVYKPGGHVRFVPVPEFLRRSPPAIRSRIEWDECHRDNRAVLCEPTGILNRWFGKVTPSRALSRNFPEDPLLQFSTPASLRMAERARNTYGLLRCLYAEFSEMGFTTLAKIGYRTDGGNETDIEHLWFSIRALHDDQIDATLENQPYHIARMKQGDRGLHPISQMTDWMILTPAGSINPRNTVAARRMRENPEFLDKMRKIMKECRREEESSKS